MSLTLPKSVADYFAADAGDGAAVADCFTVDAVVIDEGRTHRGREAIAQWKSEASAKYDYVSVPVAAEAGNGEGVMIVTAHVSGNFPGSPVDLRYAFTLTDGAISRLEVVP